MELAVRPEFYLNFAKFFYTTIVVLVFSYFLYLPKNGKKEYLLTNVMLSAIIFMICAFIRNVQLGLGFAIGIFAIFGIIRYRTVTISAREMTYLFLSVGIAAKNALVPSDFNYFTVVLSDTILVLLLWGIEAMLSRTSTMVRKLITYDNVDLITPEKETELKADLSAKLGITQIEKIKVGKVNLKESTARLEIYFIDKDERHITTQE
tara:strand:+ start:754 stop:1374 length:621 start_codon:yes stop_codon:yes gene_type:complete